MVHQYKLNGYNIVLDTCSGSVHTVDDVAYDIIEMYNEKSAEEIVNTVLDKYKAMPDVTKQEIVKCSNTIEKITGARPTIFRATGGITNPFIKKTANPTKYLCSLFFTNAMITVINIIARTT